MACASFPAEDIHNTEWPWAIGERVEVPTCATDLFGQHGRKFGKKYVFEVKGADALYEMLNELVCTCQTGHQECEGKWTAMSAYYTYKLGLFLSCGSCVV